MSKLRPLAERIALVLAERYECASYRGECQGEPYHDACVTYPPGCECRDAVERILAEVKKDLSAIPEKAR